MRILMDFRSCLRRDELYREIKSKLKLPAACGNNLDALWDCLSDMPRRPLNIVFVGIPQLPSDLRECALKIVQVFRDANEKYGGIDVLDKEG